MTKKKDEIPPNGVAVDVSAEEKHQADLLEKADKSRSKEPTPAPAESKQDQPVA